MKKLGFAALLVLVPLLVFALDSGSYKLKGSIGKRDVVLELQVKGGTVTGTMVNKNNNKTFQLQGTVEPDGKAKIKVMDGGNKVATLKGQLTASGFSGNWKNEDDDKEVQCQLASAGGGGPGRSASGPAPKPAAGAPAAPASAGRPGPVTTKVVKVAKSGRGVTATASYPQVTSGPAGVNIQALNNVIVQAVAGDAGSVEAAMSKFIMVAS